ncbi:hypothetical protein Golob_027806 [Gossypium lobatum]|uniref:RNase H type-1 domain-containing protein n=1 Tax=Gossypium lobatum TaxID=34289 RepID=A0A7J8NI83_9ROSI|nr:hypothetical protein [Gossypium lobatum]
MGILFRDYEGHILVACIYHNTFIAYATTAEAKAWLQAISVVEELGFRNLIVEGDSLTRFKNVTCSFVGQTMNQAVHVMAEEGKNWPETRVWVKEAPERAELAAEKDKSFLNRV